MTRALLTIANAKRTLTNSQYAMIHIKIGAISKKRNK
jgi:hypothetical protein